MIHSSNMTKIDIHTETNIQKFCCIHDLISKILLPLKKFFILTIIKYFYKHNNR